MTSDVMANTVAPLYLSEPLMGIDKVNTTIG